MDASARLSILVVATVLGAWAGIRAHDRAAVAGPEAPVAEAPVEAPANLIAEATIASPDATWRKAQVQVGGIVLLAPATFGALVAAVAREPSLAAVIDGGAPAYGALGTENAWVIAAHVVSPQRARSTLVEDGGALPLHTASAWIDLKGSFVLVGSSREALEALGPYAYRTLPSRGLPQSAIAANLRRAALDGPVRVSLRRKWNAVHAWLFDAEEKMRSAKNGRAPDLGDPQPLLGELDAIESAYADRIAGMERADVALDVDDDGFHARVTLAPHEGDVARWVESLGGGSTEPFAGSSRDALATFFWRSDEKERESAARETSDVLTRVVGARVPARDEAKLGEILAGIARERGDWALASVTGGGGVGALLRFESRDPGALGSSVAGVVDLARKPTWSKWESDAFGVTKIDRDGDRATFTTQDGAFQATWAPRGGELDFAAGLDATSVLASAAPASALTSDPPVATWLRSLHANVVWALVARPLLLSSTPRSDALLVALEHDAGAAVLDARAPGVLVRELVVAASKEN